MPDEFSSDPYSSPSDFPGAQPETTAGNLQRKADDLRAAATEKVEQVRGQVGDAYGAAREQVRSIEQDCEEYVRSNPLQAVLAALGVGFVIGLILRR
ncbi:MAG TPA: hypothetical protein VGO90_11785 [Chthoniobacteraceae bacterium]|jgi:ElaB/YqjD/DUF883 family membrane-anchored ribosome-binding protein|nr:hypothetical protein [Chthoniobacter sp.]HEV7868355.1 hypothetical protein [Chthoniobacteraceae bacterium]